MPSPARRRPLQAAAAPRVITLDYTPQPRQALLHATPARQLFYGGAAGGGKSVALRNEALWLGLLNPGLQAFLFRRTMPELESNHIQMLRRLPPELGFYHETRQQFVITAVQPHSTITCGYAEHEKDIWRYRGREMHWIGVDEASLMTPLQLGVLRGWNRVGNWKPSPAFAHFLPRCVFASNPGGPSHDFLKQTFILPAPPERVFWDPTLKDPNNPADKGWTSIYIPAKISDNKYLDKGYAGNLGGLPPDLARAYREGDWDIVPGAALELLSRDRHLLRPFVPPRHWTHFMSIDWGTARPFSIGWYCVSEGALLKGKDGHEDKWLPAGAIIRFREWYGWNGRHNEGCRFASQVVARRILELEESWNLPPMDFRVGDSAMWAQHDGPGPAHRFADAGVTLRPSTKDRKAGYAEARARLAGNSALGMDGALGEHPMLFVTSNCRHFWRTIPALSLDELEPDKGPDTKLEDHVYDEVVYALRQRPFVSTEDQRWQADIEAARRETFGSGDWYGVA